MKNMKNWLREKLKIYDEIFNENFIYKLENIIMKALFIASILSLGISIYFLITDGMSSKVLFFIISGIIYLEIFFVYFNSRL